MGRRRENKVTFRVDDDESAIVHGLAEKAHLPMEEYIRRCILSADKILIQDGEAIRKLTAEVNRIGNNINQVVRVANSTKGISSGEIQRIISWEQEIQRMMYRLKFPKE